MSLGVFNFILWIPFLLVFLGIGIPFSLKGFRKGLFRSLLSVAATVAVICISFFAAKLFAPLAVGKVVALLPELSGEEEAILNGILPMVIEGAVTGILSLIIFSVFLAILTPVGKFLFALIPAPKAKGLITRVLGLGLRFAESVALAIFLLLPIYGTLAAYTPAVETVLSFSEEADTQETLSIADYAISAAKHPVVSLAKAAPFSTVYNELSSAKTSVGTVNVPKMIKTMTQTVDAFRSILDGNFNAKDFERFLKAQKAAVNSDWFYTVFSSVSGLLESRLQETGDSAPTYLKAMQTLMGLPREKFTQSYAGLLDWMNFASEKGLFREKENGTLNDAWIDQSGVLDKAAEIEKDIPSEFPFMDVVNQFCGRPAA